MPLEIHVPHHASVEYTGRWMYSVTYKLFYYQKRKAKQYHAFTALFTRSAASLKRMAD